MKQSRDAVNLAVILDEVEQVESLLADLFLHVNVAKTVTPDQFGETTSRYGTDFVETFLYFMADCGYAESSIEGGWSITSSYETWVSLLFETRHVFHVLEAASRESSTGTFELVCTLPEQDPTFDDYSPVDFGMRKITSSLLSICRRAEDRLTVVSPFLETSGVEWIEPGISGALERGVAVQIVSRELSRGEPNLEALSGLRDHCGRVDGDLTVYDYYEGDPRSETPRYTLHSKLVLADDRLAYVGSANFTAYGFSQNFEIGAILENGTVRQLRDLLDRLIDCSATEVEIGW